MVVDQVAGEKMIELLREYKVAGTFGVMTFEDGTEFFTVERPWASNKPRLSCIPEGVYRLALRESPVVQRTSGGAYRKGWTVLDVPGRSLIMLHVANLPKDVEGCIGMGLSRGRLNGQEAVLNSRAAFSQMMQLLSKRSEWFIHITSHTGYPERTET